MKVRQEAFARRVAVVALVALVSQVALVAAQPAAAGTGGRRRQDRYRRPADRRRVALGQGMDRGAKLAIEQANDQRTVKAAGVKLVAVSGDDQGDPKTGVTVANTFASDPASSASWAT